MAESGKPLSELRQAIRKYPQAQRTVAVKSQPALESVPAIQTAMTTAEQALAPRGRVLVRYSGTEPNCASSSKAAMRACLRRTPTTLPTPCAKVCRWIALSSAITLELSRPENAIYLNPKHPPTPRDGCRAGGRRNY